MSNKLDTYFDKILTDSEECLDLIKSSDITDSFYTNKIISKILEKIKAYIDIAEKDSSKNIEVINSIILFLKNTFGSKVIEIIQILTKTIRNPNIIYQHILSIYKFVLHETVNRLSNDMFLLFTNSMSYLDDIILKYNEYIHFNKYNLKSTYVSFQQVYNVKHINDSWKAGIDRFVVFLLTIISCEDLNLSAFELYEFLEMVLNEKASNYNSFYKRGYLYEKIQPIILWLLQEQKFTTTPKLSKRCIKYNEKQRQQ